jgi:hypothetical protein
MCPCLQLVSSDQVASVKADLANKAEEETAAGWESEKARVGEEKRAELEAAAAGAAEAAEAARVAAEVSTWQVGMGWPDIHWLARDQGGLVAASRDGFVRLQSEVYCT